MKLVRFHAHGALRVGAIDGEEVVDARTAIELKRPLSEVEAAMLHDMVPLIEGGPRALDLVDEAIAISRAKEGARGKVSDLRLLAPLAPGLILASGGNYKDHREEKDEAPLAGREP